MMSGCGADAEKYGCSDAEIGRYIAIPNMMHWFAQFFSAALEKQAARMGFAALAIRRGCVLGASAWSVS